ncbi:PLAT/LH2 domain-containing protein [Thermomonospora umbrina]|uniref:PLAT/LH2 domain-containing protein n=1 Tax=Thermomonospora umbrina TaxID=111806 RepID=A0A3D9SXZ9_9ACTN|nr:PLAT/LH2 domain-containing protein [Thermomonospora umbrina]REF00729.1 PLAT/LH2 domain-containing protein [Thermomonospora umbrina]
MARYEIIVETGNIENSGTDADVSITLYGDAGSAGPVKLDDGRDNFENGAIDHFVLDLPAVGRLETIRIGHDNSGDKAGWFLNRVLITDPNETVEFAAYRWLATDENDGKTEVRLARR